MAWLMYSYQVVEYCAYTLLNGYQDDKEIPGYLDKYDFYMFPVVNPDGKHRLETRIAYTAVSCLF